MKTLIVLTLLLLNGCAVVSQFPSLKYCDSVSYLREGRSITLVAHCFEAVETAIPLPLPGKP